MLRFFLIYIFIFPFTLSSFEQGPNNISKIQTSNELSYDIHIPI
jgi:hypothetical protein